MFTWYKNFDVCYVYLVDVEDPDDVAGKLCSETKEIKWDDGIDRRNPVEDNQ